MMNNDDKEVEVVVESVKKKEEHDNENDDDEHDDVKVVPSLSMRLDIQLAPVIGMNSDDTTTVHYNSIRQMWIEQGVIVENDNEISFFTTNEWYQRGKSYYDDECDETLQGVLGGYESISFIDLETSHNFLMELQKMGLWQLPSSSFHCCEVGAGIGRVSKGLLLPLNPSSSNVKCDLLEVSEHLLSYAPDYLGDEYANCCRYYCTGIQNWKAPTTTRYHLIWIQWVLCYLTDHDVIIFLKECSKALVDDDNTTLIVLKENTTTYDKTFVLDEKDASITRSLSYWLALIDETNCFDVVHQIWQPNFPSELFPVPILALKKKKK